MTAELDVTSTEVLMALSPARILVVDDDERNRRLLDAMLVPDGYHVLEAASGEEALDVLAREEVDLVLLDVMMDGIDGIETCHRIRQRPDLAFLPVVFITALGDREARIRGKAVGGDDFLTKPVDEIELRIRIRNLILIQNYREELEEQNRWLEDEVERRTAELRHTVERLAAAEQALRTSHQITIERLARAAEFRDDAGARHTQRMSRYCRLLAKAAGLQPDRCDLILLASPMHDVGKIGVPDHILRKPAPLTPSESEVIRRHPLIGHRILSDSGSELLDLAASIALTHHEKVDGTGYPGGLKGQAIPIEGRIAAIADVFDALSTPRVYKAAYPMDKTLTIMRQGRGKHFDPALLDLFLDSIDEILVIMAGHPDERG